MTTRTRLTVQYGHERQTMAAVIVESDDAELVDGLAMALLQLSHRLYSDGTLGCSVLHEIERNGQWVCPVT